MINEILTSDEVAERQERYLSIKQQNRTNQ